MGATVGGIDQLLARFQAATATWGGPLERIALGVFISLAAIDLIWCMIRVLLNRPTGIEDFIYALAHELIFLGFFLFVLTSFTTVAPIIIKGFQWAAQQAGGIPTQPNGIFAEGVKIATDIINQMSILSPGDAVSLLLCGLVIIACFAIITAAMVMVIVESFFIISAGQILLMFGGSHFTSDKVQALLWQVVGVGLKLFILQMIASVGSAFVAGWVAATPADAATFQDILIEIGQSIVLLAITLELPARFERMVNHIGSSGAGSLAASGGAVAAAGALMSRSITSAVTKAIGAGSAVGAAGKLASTQASGGGGPSSAAGRAAAMVGSTAGNLVSAAATDIGRGLRGTRGNAGQMPWRMATNLSERNRLAEEDKKGP